MATLTEQVIAEIRERILDGKYPVGTHLHEAALAKDLDVSRTPIRDALRVLANDNILVYHANRGYMVRPVDLKDVLDSYDVRGTLEGLACRIVAETGLDEAGKAVFAAIIERGEAVFASAKWEAEEQAAWRRINTDFHSALLEASGNRHLDPIMQMIRAYPRIYDSRLNPEAEFFQKVHTRDQRLRSHHDHSAIVEALLRREGARAEALMREHVYLNRELLRSGLQTTTF
jgi:GntR family transcriptional regulator, vanillate catabolism transcriptional regulator